MEPTWVSLTSTLISGAFGVGLGAILTVWLEHKNEKKRMIFERKFVTYSNLFNFVLSIGGKNISPEQTQEMVKTIGEIFILLGDDKNLKDNLDDIIKTLLMKPEDSQRPQKIRQLLIRLSQDINKTF